MNVVCGLWKRGAGGTEGLDAMLAALPAHLRIGVRRATPVRPLDYHAWLTVGGESVIGGRPAGTFVSLPWPRPTVARDARP